MFNIAIILKRGYYYPLLLLFLSACTTGGKKVQRLIFYKEQSFSAPVVSNQSPMLGKAEILKTNDSIICFVDNQCRLIRFWNLYKGIYEDSIDINYHPKQVIEAFHFQNMDSIILAFLPTYLFNFHDSCIILTDRHKKINGTFSFEGAPVPMYHKNPGYTMNSGRGNWAYNLYNRSLLKYDDKRKAVITNICYWGKFQCKGGTKWASGIVFLDSTKKYFPLPVKFGCEGEGYYSSELLHPRGCYDNSGNTLYGVGYSGRITKSNYNTLKTITAYPKFIGIDSIYQTKEDIDDNYYTAEYLDISFDPLNNTYWRGARLSRSNDDPILLKNNPTYVLMKLDSNLDMKGQGILPYGNTVPIIPYKNGLLAYDWINSRKERKIIFSFLKYTIDYVSITQYKKDLLARRKSIIKNNTKVAKLNLYAYLTNETQHGAFHKYLVIPIENTCPGCITSFGSFLSSNKEELIKKHDIGIIFISSNPNKVKEYLKQYNIESLLNKVVFIDGSYTQVNSLMESWVNFKAITLNEKGKIREQKIFGPEESLGLHKYIMSTK